MFHIYDCANAEDIVKRTHARKIPRCERCLNTNKLSNRLSWVIGFEHSCECDILREISAVIQYGRLCIL